MSSKTDISFQILTGQTAAALEVINVDTTVDLSPGQLFFQWFQGISLGANAVPGTPYIVKLTLDRADLLPLTNCFYHIEIEFDATDDPTVEIYDNTTAGTKLQTVSANAAGVSTFAFIGRFDGSVWTKYNGGFVI